MLQILTLIALVASSTNPDSNTPTNDLKNQKHEDELFSTSNKSGIYVSKQEKEYTNEVKRSNNTDKAGFDDCIASEKMNDSKSDLEVEKLNCLGKNLSLEQNDADESISHGNKLKRKKENLQTSINEENDLNDKKSEKNVALLNEEIHTDQKHNDNSAKYKSKGNDKTCVADDNKQGDNNDNKSAKDEEVDVNDVNDEKDEEGDDKEENDEDGVNDKEDESSNNSQRENNYESKLSTDSFGEHLKNLADWERHVESLEINMDNCFEYLAKQKEFFETSINEIETLEISDPNNPWYFAEYTRKNKMMHENYISLGKTLKQNLVQLDDLKGKVLNQRQLDFYDYQVDKAIISMNSLETEVLSLREKFKNVAKSRFGDRIYII